ncbi:MAG: NAD-dependent epimerase/dehydratase family protein [Halioglobus sp.]
MNIVITGAGGFIGQAVIAALEETGKHQLLAVDTSAAPSTAPSATPSAKPSLTHTSTQWLQGDIAEPGVIDELFAKPCDAVLHLATVPGGAAEDNRAQAQRVNIDASLALLEAARSATSPPRIVFASSIAVYGELDGGLATDDTILAPRMIYGAQKAMIETWVSALTQRGEIQGLSLRLPGVVARPLAPSGMKSAFMSNLFHAARAGEPFTCPVSPEATMWLMSRPKIVENLLHALTLDAEQLRLASAMTLPPLRLSMHELVTAVAQATGYTEDFVSYQPDPDLEAVFGQLPPHRFTLAKELGFKDDSNVEQLVMNALSYL